MGRISLAHGSGGRLTSELIKNIFAKHFSLDELEDAAYLSLGGEIAVTTDSFVVRPLFFPGGDIGKLAVCGTLNDLAVSGAEPLALTCGFVLEEGFEIRLLEEVVSSMVRESQGAGIKVVAGDTKVVEKGKAEGMYINTTGIGRVVRRFSVGDVSPGDLVLVTGSIGEHGMSIFLAREDADVEVDLESDCANMYPLLSRIFNKKGVKWMRDATRGGLATVCLELSDATGLGIRLYEEKIPVREDVSFLCDMFGFDPIYLANEGRAVVVVSKGDADEVLEVLTSHWLGEKASVIGEVTEALSGVVMVTSSGGVRAVDYLEEDPVPRIC